MSAAPRFAPGLIAAAIALTGCGAGGDAPATPTADAPMRYGMPPADAAASTPAVAVGERLLEYPDDAQMVLLAQRLAGGDPATTIRRWAEGSDAVRRANEFQRNTVLAAETARLDAVLASVAGVGRLRIRTTTPLGDYDPANGVWYLRPFQPGQAFRFGHQQASAQLAMSNARAAYRWPMALAEAESLKRRVQYRNVEIDIDLVITGGRMRGDGPQIDSRIAEYRLHLDGPQAADIGHVTLP